MNINYKLIGKRIKTYRNQKNFSQMELADRTNLSVPYISYIETGKKKVSLDALINIAEALGTTPDHLLVDHIIQIDGRLSAEFSVILNDCNTHEKLFIQDMLYSLKDAIRNNKWFCERQPL